MTFFPGYSNTSANLRPPTQDELFMDFKVSANTRVYNIPPIMLHNFLDMPNRHSFPYLCQHMSIHRNIGLACSRQSTPSKMTSAIDMAICKIASQYSAHVGECLSLSGEAEAKTVTR